MQLTSPAYEDGGPMPQSSATQRAGGRDESPAYEWTAPPDGTRSMALTVVDRSARDWVHWHVVEMPAEPTSVPAGASGRALPQHARELLNTFGTRGWEGPQPPPGTGVHRYEATVFALDIEKVPVAEDVDEATFERAISGHVLARASITGTMER